VAPGLSIEVSQGFCDWVFSTTHRRGSKTKPRLAWGSLTTSNCIPCSLARLRRCVTRIGLINESQFNGLTGDLLHGLRQLAHLGAVLLIGWGDQQCQQIAQRIDSGMDFAAFASFGSIIARAAATDLSSIAGSDYRR
jgi:hypothetical protein